MGIVTSARFILQPDGLVHIALDNSFTYACTAIGLRNLLQNPEMFKIQKCNELQNTTQIVNPQGLPVDKIRGITLGCLDSEKSLHFDYADLFILAYKKINTKKENEQIDINEALCPSALVDRKQFLLMKFFDLAKDSEQQSFSQNISLSYEQQSVTLREIFNYITEENKPTLASTIENTKNKSAQDSNILVDGDYIAPVKIPSHYVDTEAFAKINKVLRNTVQEWCRKNKLSSAIKDSNGVWFIDPNDKPLDRRAKRIVKPDKKTGKKHNHLQGNSYEEVQQYLVDRNLFTSAFCPFIRSKEEASFYEHLSYHEVLWNGEMALIIDINPDYISPKLQKSNAQLIAEGKSPIVPGTDEITFDLHHVGQKTNSPFAIIAHDLHISSEYSKFFHLDKEATEDIHSNTYNMQKIAFWNKYMEEYKKYKKYVKIPYLNPKSKRKETK